MATLYNIATQVQRLTNKGSWQEILQSVRNNYAFVVKGIWFENKKMDVGTIDGGFIISFPDQQPIKDIITNKYYVNISSTYLQLPQESGIVSVSYMSEPDTNFVLTNSGTVGRLSRIKAGVVGGRQLYYTDNMKMVFPRMTNTTSLPIMLRLAVAVDTIDVDEQINISPNIQAQIIQLVVQQFTTSVQPINENIK
jgi:hypothetical protein